MKNFTYIIPFNSSIDNLNHLRKVIKWVNGWNNIELIVVEYDNNPPKLSILSEPFKHVYIKAGAGTFNKAWAYNAGVRNSSSDVIIFGDANTLTNPDNIKKGMDLLKEYDVVKPFSKMIDITPTQLNDFKVMDDTIDAPVVGESGDRPYYLCSGITMYKRDTILKIGGWEEKFQMDCYDDFQSYKVKKLTKWTEMEGKGFSLPCGKPHSDNLVSKDVNTCNKLKVLNDQQLTGYISTTYNNVGIKNKYE